MTLCGQDISLLLLSVVITALSFATPITLGALSGVICERAGVVNIAIEGMMLSGAFGGYWAAVTFHSLPLAVLSAVLVGGLLAGLGGASYVPGYIPAFSPGLTNGYGFIALAAMIFGKWNPIGAWLATLFFGLTLSIQNNLQSCKVVEGPVPVGIVGMLPYIVTLLVLAGFVGRSTPPAADGVPF